MSTGRKGGPGGQRPDGKSAPSGADGGSPRMIEDHQSLSDLIADRAYFIWLQRGKPEHGALDIWFQAESQVLREYIDRQARRGSLPDRAGDGG